MFSPSTSENHNIIVANLIAALHPVARKRPCKLYPAGMTVAIPDAGTIKPSISVACGEPSFAEEERLTLTSPVLIIELLPHTPADADPYADYLKIPSLGEILLISQTEPNAELRRRARPDEWVATSFYGLGAAVDLATMGARVPLADIYEGVRF